MSKYQILKLLFLVSIACCLILDQVIIMPVFIYPLIILVFLSILVLGVFIIRMNFFVKALNSRETAKKQIALTFDDGPGKGTDKILNVLGKYGAKASFFCIGKNVEQYPDILKAIDYKGHLIGNHTYSHEIWIDFKNRQGWKQELERTNKLIYENIGKEPTLFRPPFGVTNPTIAAVVKSMKLKVAGWSIRSLDTVKTINEKLANKLTAKIRPGAVILLHEHVSGSEQLLEQILQYCNNEGYECVGLDELFNLEAYA